MKNLFFKMALLAAAFSVIVNTANAQNSASNDGTTQPIQKPSFTAADADTAFAAYNKAFYVVEDGKGYYKEDETGGKNHFWTQAEEIEMMIDTWERTHSPETKSLIDQSINGFNGHFGTNWLSNGFNDDLFWMTIASARAFLMTSNTAYEDLAKFHFDQTFTRAWSTNLGGGLWWSTTNASKNACVNGPGTIAACYLYQITGDQSYLDKAKAVYAWERTNLFVESSGAIRDNMRANGRIGGGALTYNQGTFIGAANFLGKLTGDKSYFADAEKAADYTRDKLCADGILPGYRGNDGPGFNGIFIRWLAKFAGDNHLWPKYQSWMIQNANAAWSRRRADNLAWNRWQMPTPDNGLHAWACADTVIIMNVVPLELSQ
ncbi:MAG TPA: glycoside hydrolase family 76 protein [Verrucomicrobiae bacterium]|jgi:predicted alpha-1,6-mannanase (GH76 family)